MSGTGSEMNLFKEGSVLPVTTTTSTSGGPLLNSMKSNQIGGKRTRTRSRSNRKRTQIKRRKSHKSRKSRK